MSLPEGVYVREEWAVRAGDGEIYRVTNDAREAAEREAALLRAGQYSNGPEPGAAPARRFVMNTPDGTTSTGWRRWL
jgi:hypothetical protein